MIKKMLQASPVSLPAAEDVTPFSLLLSLAATFMSMGPLMALWQYFLYY